MSKEKWQCLLLVAVALAIGVLVGKSCGHKTTLMVVGRVYPSPNNGDKLNWVYQNGKAVTSVQWVPPGSAGASPCREQAPDSAANSTCTIHYQSKKPKVYHYICDGCADPGTAGGGGSNGGPNPFMILYDEVVGWFGAAAVFSPESPSTPLPSGGVSYSAQAGFNTATSASGVYWFSPSDGSYEGFVPIKVNAGLDQVVWEPVGDAAWKVVVASGTCVEGTTSFPDPSGNSTCTIQGGSQPAQSQYYCVVYNNNPPNAPVPGNAVLQVGGKPPSGDPPTPSCALTK